MITETTVIQFIRKIEVTLNIIVIFIFIREMGKYNEVVKTSTIHCYKKHKPKHTPIRYELVLKSVT